MSYFRRLVLLVIGPWLVAVMHHLGLRSGQCWRSVLLVSSSYQFVPFRARLCML